MGHVRPREEEATGRAVLKAIFFRASVQIELRLNDSGQACNPKVRPRKTTKCLSIHMRPHHLRDDASHLSVVIHVVLSVHRERIDLGSPWSLLLLVPGVGLIDSLQKWCCCTTKLKPAKNVGVQSRPILRLRTYYFISPATQTLAETYYRHASQHMQSTVPPVLKNPQRREVK